MLAEDGKTQKTYYVTVKHGDVGASGAELDVNSIKLKNSVLNVMDILEKEVTKASDGATEILLTVRAGVDTSKMYLSANISYAATVDPSLDGKDAMNFSDWQTFTVTSGDETVQNIYRIKVVSGHRRRSPASVCRQVASGTMASLTMPRTPLLSPVWTIPS